MTLQDVIEKVKYIDSIKGDDEAAHGAEDKLHEAVLTEVASGNPESKEMAIEALKTIQIDFARWCA